MANKPVFTLTEDQLMQIKGLEEEDTKLESEIAERQKRRDELQVFLRAAAILGTEHSRNEAPKMAANGSGDSGSSDLTKAVERIANDSVSPLTKKEMKDKLRAANFAEDRLGAYFYTVVARLKEKKRIRVLRDGRITRKAHENE